MRHPVGIKGVVPDTPSQPFSDDPFTRHPIDDEVASGVRAAPFCPRSRAPSGAGASVLLALRRDHRFVRLAAERRCVRPAPANLHTAQTRAGSGGIGWVGLLGTGQVVLAARQGSWLVAIWLAALVLWLGVTAYHASLEPAFRSWEERRRPSDEAGVAGPAPPETAP